MLLDDLALHVTNQLAVCMLPPLAEQNFWFCMSVTCTAVGCVLSFCRNASNILLAFLLVLKRTAVAAITPHNWSNLASTSLCCAAGLPLLVSRLCYYCISTLTSPQTIHIIYSCGCHCMRSTPHHNTTTTRGCTAYSQVMTLCRPLACYAEVSVPSTCMQAEYHASLRKSGFESNTCFLCCVGALLRPLNCQ